MPYFLSDRENGKLGDTWQWMGISSPRMMQIKCDICKSKPVSNS